MGWGCLGWLCCCFFFLMILLPPRSTLFPYTTLFRSSSMPSNIPSLISRTLFAGGGARATNIDDHGAACRVDPRGPARRDVRRSAGDEAADASSPQLPPVLADPDMGPANEVAGLEQ